MLGKRPLLLEVLTVHRGLNRHDCKGVEANKKGKKKGFSVLTSNYHSGKKAEN